MGRLPTGKVREWVYLHKEQWDFVKALARKYGRSKDEQMEIILEDWRYFVAAGYGREDSDFRKMALGRAMPKALDEKTHQTISQRNKPPLRIQGKDDDSGSPP